MQHSNDLKRHTHIHTHIKRTPIHCHNSNRIQNSHTHTLPLVFYVFFRVALRALRYELLPLSLQTEIDATTTACCFKRPIVGRPHRLTPTTRRWGNGNGNGSSTLMFLAFVSLPPEYCVLYWSVVVFAWTHKNGDDVLLLFLNSKLFFVLFI